MEVNAQIIQQRINQILWGKIICEVEDASNNLRTFVLRSLTSHENNYLDFIYNREFRLAVEDGLLTEEHLLEVYRDQELWTERDEIILKGLANKIKILEDQISGFQFQTGRRKRAERQKKRTEEEFEEKRRYKSQLFMLSAENRAEEVKRRFMIMMAAENIRGEPYWEDEDIFLEEVDLHLIYNLALAYFDRNVFNEAETREIARSPSWRFRWQAAKKGADLFGKPISEWSEMQSAIVYWSQFYDVVYESTDRPSDVVIADDTACDRWYSEYVKRLSAKTGSSSKNDRNLLGTKKSKTNKFHQEQFIFVDPNDPESVKKLQDMNSPSVRNRLQSEHEKLKEAKGRRIKEWDLRKREYLVGSMKEFTKVKEAKKPGIKPG